MQFQNATATASRPRVEAASQRETWALWVAAGATLGMLGVVIGAAGTHALADRLDADSMDTLETAVRFQMYHALALVAVGAIRKAWPVSRAVTLSASLLLFGAVVFCGSLYLLALLDIGLFGAIAPIGGLSLMAGWGTLAVAAAQRFATGARQRGIS